MYHKLTGECIVCFMCVTSVIMHHKWGGGGGVCVPETDCWVHFECFMCVMSVIMYYKCVCASETDWWVMSVIMYYKCVCVLGGGGSCVSETDWWVHCECALGV